MRRSRYTIRFGAEREPIVVLAYSLEGARQCGERYGTVTRVTTGDYRKVARAAEVKAAGGFRIDVRALNAAIETLEIKSPVDIRFHGRIGQTNGTHRFDGKRHQIMVKSYHTPEQASSTLWHELTHAMQAERAGGTYEWRREVRAQASMAYRARPLEREARAMSERMKDSPLTRAI